MATATFDNQWTLTLSCQSNTDTMFIGNGKVGISTSGSHEKTIITTTVHHKNTIATFNSTDICIEGYSNMSGNMTQSINMYTGIYTREQTLTNSNAQTITLSQDLYASRTLPFCTLGTVRITATCNQDTSNLVIYHNFSCPPNLHNPQYNNNIVYDDLTSKGIYILTGASENHVAMATAYDFSSLTTPPTSLGFNVLTPDMTRAFNAYKIQSLLANTTASFSFVTANMTSADFDTPIEECKRIVLAVMNQGTAVARAAHVKAWSHLWNTSLVSIIPKSGITADNANQINTYNRFLKYSLYNIYSRTRAGYSTEVNASNFGMIDETGQILYNGDLFFIPMLLLLHPDYARSILEYRTKTLKVARQLAAGYGYSGAKFPYEDDRVGYKNALYWTTHSSFTIYNTALISINIWNYYRRTMDKQWLQDYGFPVLKDNADFFVSLVTESNNSNIDMHSIENTVSLSGTVSKSNNVFTNAVVRLALRFAIEASYELSLGHKQEWDENYWNLPLPIDGQVYQYDDQIRVSGACTCPMQTQPTTTVQPFIPIAEPLILFVPCYTTPNDGRFQNIAVAGINQCDALSDNLGAYLPLISDWSNPLNNAILAILQGRLAQSDPTTSIPQFQTALDQFIAHNTATSAWGNMRDLTVYALYLAIFLQGIAGLNLQGGVAETRFYYQEMQLTSATSANMPQAWKSVKVAGTRATYLTQNVLAYVQ